MLGAFAFFSGLYLLQNLLAWNKTVLRPDATPAETPAIPHSGTAERPRLRSPLAGELLRWLRPLEFALYFVAYAASIPWLGYLLSTAIFMPLLGLRTGIRSASGLGLLAGLGIGIVLVFKTGLEVRMPPGALYDLFPPQVRNFLIRNF